MKNDLELDFDIYGHEKENKEDEFSILLIFKKILESFFKISIYFILISIPTLLILLYIKKNWSENENIFLKGMNEYFSFIKNLIFKPFSQDKGDDLNIFFLTTLYSLFFSSLINYNFSFFNGFLKGIEKTKNILIIKRRDYLLEKKFVKEELIKSLEDIQNKIVKMQYDFFEFVKNNERINNNNFQYEVEKNVNPEFDQMKKKIDLLESSLGKINENIFDLGLNMSRNNYNWRFPRKRISYNNRDFENKEKTDNQDN
jgi:hypothetical protein